MVFHCRRDVDGVWFARGSGLWSVGCKRSRKVVEEREAEAGRREGNEVEQRIH